MMRAISATASARRWVALRGSGVAEPSARVVATGGLANLIADEVTCIDAVEPELTLLGVRIIYEKNK